MAGSGSFFAGKLHVPSGGKLPELDLTLATQPLHSRNPGWRHVAEAFAIAALVVSTSAQRAETMLKQPT
jgi:hypothetical protein